uniref:Ribonuclease H-like domain-containing protein n=1 Tax=Tanacetum cinerariifolium TaxID=118510 RepID=A0A6L2MM34_TANCI|nr:ribonuclease H-like domain-containing protein [Tanacetum cinerariifolium]
MVTRSQLSIVKPIDRLSLNTFFVSPIPKNSPDALKDPQWRNAMYDEYNALVKNGTWLLVPQPTGVNMVHSMLLFKHKFHDDGTLSHYKARMVANDSSQQLGYKKKAIMVASDPLALVAEKTKVSKHKEKVVVQSESKGSDDEDISDLKKITALLAKAFNQKKYYDKPTNNNLRTSSGHFAKDCKKEKAKDYNYYKTKMLLAKKDSDEQVLLAETKLGWSPIVISIKRAMQIWSSWLNEKEYYDNSTNYGLFVDNDDDQEIFHDAVEFASEIFNENHIVSQIDNDQSEVDHNDYEETDHLVDKLIKKFNQKIAKCQKYLDTLSSVRRPKHSGVIWKKKGSSNTSNVDLSSVSISKLNKDVKRYSRKDLLSCNNSHNVDTRSAYACNDATNVFCNSRLYASYDVNDVFVFDDIIQICLWIIDFGCSKHMTGNRALLTNFVETFLGMVRFGNNDSAVIAGYGDVVIGLMKIKKVYYVKDLLTGDRSSNLYTIALNDIASNSSDCLLSKASSSQSWLWRKRLSHLNFAIINNLVKNNLVRGLPTMKFKKDHLCFACEQGKIHRKHHKSKTYFASNKQLYLLHMDLCSPMCAESINEKQYVLVLSMIIHAQGKWVYSKESTTFRVYNKRTQKIHKSVNVNFDEISKMASKQFNLEPGLSNLNETRKFSNPTILQVSEISKKYLDDIFHNFYDEYFDSSKITKSLTMNVEIFNNDIPSHEGEVFHEVSKLFQEESSLSSLNDNVQQSSEEVMVPPTKTQSISNYMVPNVNEASSSHNMFNERLEDVYFDASTMFHDPSNVHTFYQPYLHEKK